MIDPDTVTYSPGDLSYVDRLVSLAVNRPLKKGVIELNSHIRLSSRSSSLSSIPIRRTSLSSNQPSFITTPLRKIPISKPTHSIAHPFPGLEVHKRIQGRDTKRMDNVDRPVKRMDNVDRPVRRVFAWEDDTISSIPDEYAVSTEDGSSDVILQTYHRRIPKSRAERPPWKPARYRNSYRETRIKLRNARINRLLHPNAIKEEDLTTYQAVFSTPDIDESKSSDIQDQIPEIDEPIVETLNPSTSDYDASFVWPKVDYDSYPPTKLPEEEYSSVPHAFGGKETKEKPSTVPLPILLEDHPVKPQLKEQPTTYDSEFHWPVEVAYENYPKPPPRPLETVQSALDPEVINLKKPPTEGLPPIKESATTKIVVPKHVPSRKEVTEGSSTYDDDYKWPLTVDYEAFQPISPKLPRYGVCALVTDKTDENQASPLVQHEARPPLFEDHRPPISPSIHTTYNDTFQPPINVDYNAYPPTEPYPPVESVSSLLESTVPIHIESTAELVLPTVGAPIVSEPIAAVPIVSESGAISSDMHVEDVPANHVWLDFYPQTTESTYRHDYKPLTGYSSSSLAWAQMPSWHEGSFQWASLYATPK